MEKTKMMLILTFLLCAAGALQAQQKRYVDLSADFMSPTDGTIIENGASVPLKFKITNLGPDSVKINDTLYVTGNAVNIANGQVGAAPMAQALPPGAAMQLQVSGFQNYSNNRTAGSDTTFDLCFAVYARNAIDTSSSVKVYDTIPANNKKCISITLKGKPTGIAGLSDGLTRENLNIYPNPARDNATLEFNIAKSAAVTVRITDIAGREVLRRDCGKMNNGIQKINLDLAKLPPGLYITEVQAGQRKAIGKLYIQ